MAWTTDRTTKLRKMWAEGLSASQIAKELGGVTRNAVIGKVHRLGLTGRAKPSRPKKARLKSIPKGGKRKSDTSFKPSRVNERGAGKMSKPHMRPYGKPKPPATLIPKNLAAEDLLLALSLKFPFLRNGKQVTISTVKDGQCKWPIDNKHAKQPHTLCGRTVSGPDEPYCSGHSQQSTSSKKTSRKMTGVEAQRELAERKKTKKITQSPP